MAQAADAFLAIWHDIDAAFEPEWHQWHSFEHMPERVAIPGFLAGRRYMNRTASRHVCFMLYEGENLDVFNSPAYLERLNAPTPWTRRMAPGFQDFLRGACRCIGVHGPDNGYGGAALTLRYTCNADVRAPEPGAGAAATFCEKTCRHPGITSVRIGMCEHAVTDVETNERTLRSATGEQRYDAVIVVEGMGQAELRTIEADITRAANTMFTGYTCDATEIYELSYMLRKTAGD